MRSHNALMVAIAVLSPVVLQAQDAGGTLLWRANSAVSPTLMPDYGGQPSPFMRNTQEDDSVKMEAEAIRLARMKAMQQAETVLNSPAALVPNLSGFSFAGRLIGAQGVKVFFNNTWLGVGSQLSAPMEISNEARNALSVLQQQDLQAAEELERRLQSRLSAHGPLKLTLANIGEASVTLKSAKESFEISLQRSGF